MSKVCSLKDLQSAFERDVAGLELSDRLHFAVSAQRTALYKKFEDDEEAQEQAHLAAIEGFLDNNAYAGMTGPFLRDLIALFSAECRYSVDCNLDMLSYPEAYLSEIIPGPLLETREFPSPLCESSVSYLIEKHGIEKRFTNCNMYIIMVSVQILFKVWKSSRGVVPHQFYIDCGGYEVLDRSWNQGPGAFAKGAKEDCIDTSWYSKFFLNTRTSSNPTLQAYVTQLLHSHPHWRNAEFHRQEACAQGNRESMTSFVPGQFFTVVKNADVRRPCVREPSDNMLLQKSQGDAIETELINEFDLDITIQDDINQRLAREGSLSSGYLLKFGTIDSQGCSDSVTAELVDITKGPRWLSNLRASRSPTIMIDESLIHLDTFSTMGNGFTFPLQTYIFSKLVRATYQELGVPETSAPLGKLVGHPRTWGVFGDDVIVTSNVYTQVVNLLQLVGFKINTLKSYNEGPFRESCGGDYYEGFNVRPVHCTSLARVSDRLSFLNRILQWGCHHGISLRHTLDTLLGWIPVKHRYPIPGWEDISGGIVVPESLIHHRKFARTAREVKAGDGPLLGKKYCPSRTEVDYQIGGYLYTIARPVPNRSTKFAMTTNYAGVTRVWEFPDAALLALLHGHLGSDGTVTLRSDSKPHYRARQGYTPAWTLLPPIPFDLCVLPNTVRPHTTKEWIGIAPDIVVKQYAESQEISFERYLIELLG